jgi:hypothetical protein
MEGFFIRPFIAHTFIGNKSKGGGYIDPKFKMTFITLIYKSFIFQF